MAMAINQVRKENSFSEQKDQCFLCYFKYLNQSDKVVLGIAIN